MYGLSLQAIKAYASDRTTTGTGKFADRELILLRMVQLIQLCNGNFFLFPV
jgi:hypothetical protein